MKRNHFRKLSALACVAALWCRAAAGAPPPNFVPDYLNTLRNGDAKALQAALDRGAPVNIRDAQGNTPLLLAVVYGEADCVRLLLDRGAQVNVTNASGSTPLLRAAGSADKVDLLLTHGATVNVASPIGNSPLMVAARGANSHRAVELLLNAGAAVNATNNFGATALMAAVAGGDAKSVRLLLNRGADVNAQPGVGPRNFVFGGARSPLMWAAYRGNSEILKLLLAAGADVNAEGSVGTPLSQAAWADRTEAARTLIQHGAQVNQVSHMDGFTPLHWAAATESGDAALTKLLVQHGAAVDVEGGTHIDAYMDIPQTPLMMARRRGETEVLRHLLAVGATNESPDLARTLIPPARELPVRLDRATVLNAVNQALPLLQETALVSKKSFAAHASRQDCTSCHQQYLPLAAAGLAQKQEAAVGSNFVQELAAMVSHGELGNHETDWTPVFHPDPVFTKGYALLGYASAGLPADEFTDSAVHHLAAVQARGGQWYNNLPRPPLQSDDIGATALAIQALQKYPLPGRKAEFAKRVERARRWLWLAKPTSQEGRVYQILGLAWAGETTDKLQPLAQHLVAEQRADGGWSQLPGLKSDAYATGQALYALRVGAGLGNQEPAVDRGRRYLLTSQLEDGSWYVHRRAFPFQPTMNSGFPHGRDSWISAAATSWAVMALSLPDEPGAMASN